MRPVESSPAIQTLLDELERLPGIGPKSAQRIAYWMLNTDRDTVVRLSEAIVRVKDTVHFCSQCYNYAQDDLCEICSSVRRDNTIICVVSEPRDIAAIERTGAYSGVYHVLGGALSPMDGVGVEDLRVAELMARLASEDIGEVAASIAKTGCKVLGAVMNGVNLKSFRNRRYYYRSERYSSYYNHYDRMEKRPDKSAKRK